MPQAGDEPDVPAEDAELPQERLERMLLMLREEVLEGVARIGGRLGELRLDTDLDISHGVVRYLELLKLSALHPAARRARAWPMRWRTSTRACSRRLRPLQREIFQTSTLDETLLEAELRRADAGARRIVPREEHSLGPFLPARERPGAVGVGHRDVPRLPAALQVRARPAHPDRADGPSALRDRRAPGARALPRRTARAPSSRCSELLDAGWRKSALGEDEMSASCSARRARR